MTDATDEALLTIQDAVEFIRRETGIPITRSRIEKDSSNGITPKPAATYGRRYLWRRAEMLDYARSLIKPTAA